MAATEARDIGAVFAARLKQAQAAESLTNQQLADDTGIQIRLIQKYRSGKVRPRDDNLYKLAQRLGRSATWFYSDEAEAA